MLHCIYKITNLLNNKTYVGQYNGPEYKFKHYWGSGNLIKQATKKYGRKNFKKEVIVQGDFNEALMDSLEIHYIQLYSPPENPLSYNIARGGGNGKLGVPDPNRKKIFQYTLKGEFVQEWDSSKDVANKLGLDARSIRQCASGKLLTNRGFIWLFDKDVLTERLNRINYDHRKYANSTIYQLDKNLNLVATWNSLKEIAQNTNFRTPNINDVLRGDGYTSYGFIWTENLENIRPLPKLERRKQGEGVYSKYEDIFIYKNNTWYEFSTLKDASIFLNNIGLNVIRKRLRKEYFWTRGGILYSTKKFDILPQRPLSGKSKKVKQLDKNGQLIKIWDSIKEATLEYNVGSASLSRALTKGTSSVGFIWQYA